MPRRTRALSEGERDVWASFARQVVPLRGRPAADAAPGPPAAPPAVLPEPLNGPIPSVRPAVVVRPEKRLEIGEQPGGVDRANWGRLRTGRLLSERTLDLHGRTAQRAYDALVAFLHEAQTDGVRCVEVITGRGGMAGTGVIRREMPHWLNQPPLRAMVLGAAHPHAANPGSVRLLLRRRR